METLVTEQDYTNYPQGVIYEEFPTLHPAAVHNLEPQQEQLTLKLDSIKAGTEKAKTVSPKEQPELRQQILTDIREVLGDLSQGLELDKVRSGFHTVLDALEAINKFNSIDPRGLIGNIQAFSWAARAAGFDGKEYQPELETRILRAVMPYEGSQAIYDAFVDKYRGYLLGSVIERRDDTEALWQEPAFIAHMAKRAYAQIEKYGKRSEWPEAESQLFVRAFEALGFGQEEREQITGAWSSYSAEVDGLRENTLIRNFEVMAQLMGWSAELPRRLYDTFGIRHFERYNSRDLYWQMRHWDEGSTDRPNVMLVVTALSDHNGAFMEQHKYSGLEPIFTEAASATELTRRLLSVRQRLGKVSALLIAGHGTKDSIELFKKDKITKDMIQSSKALARIRSKDIFTDGAEIILASCSTGADGGIAEEMSRISTMDVIAPPIPVPTPNIGYDANGDHTVAYDHVREPSRLLKKLGVPKKRREVGVAYTSDGKQRVGEQNPRNLFD